MIQGKSNLLKKKMKCNVTMLVCLRPLSSIDDVNVFDMKIIIGYCEIKLQHAYANKLFLESTRAA